MSEQQPYAAHAVVNHDAGNRLECLHCGAYYAPAVPAPVRVMSAILETFVKLHADCPAPAQPPEENPDEVPTRPVP